jgi:dTDP-4-dehydrorhamnose 3,5-epimerase-like enzyme
MINIDFIQDNQSFSKKGTLRGTTLSKPSLCTNKTNKSSTR